jgi:hypothetical protein
MPITPQQLAAPGDEHSHQKAFFQWLAISAASRFPSVRLCHAIPNGGKLMGTGTNIGRIEGAKMKAEGLRAGVPDVFMPVPRKVSSSWSADYTCPGLYIEFKKPSRETEKFGGRSPEQVQWQRDLLAQGYAVATCYGWQAGAHVVALYMQGGLTMPEGGDCLMALATEHPPW